MDKIITAIMTNKKKRFIWLLVSLGLSGLLTILIFTLPFMRGANHLTMQLIDIDTMQVAYIIWVVIFTTIFYLILYFYPKRDTIQDLSIIQAILRILPVPPLAGAWISTVLPLVETQDQAHYFTLGSKFMIANYMEYTGAASVNDIVAVGQGLSYGIGLYLLLAFLILSTVHYLVLSVWYVRPDSPNTLSKED